MKPTTQTILAVTAFAVLALAAVPAVHAADGCKVKIDTKTGAIQFSAKDVRGILRWGDSLGLAVHPFADADCVKNGKATKCELGAPGTADQITPPELCRLVVKDVGGGASCSAFIKGCTPGVRPGGAAASAPGGAKAGVVAFCSSDKDDVRIIRSFNNVNASAITIDDGVLAGRCEITFPFSLEDRFYSVEPVSGIIATSTFKIDYEVSGNTLSISTQEYLPPVWAGLAMRVSVLIF